MEKLTWISNNGYIIQFGKSPPFYLSSFFPNSLGTTSESVSAPYQDGASTYSTVYNPRTISARCSFSARSAPTAADRRRGKFELQQLLCAALDPKLEGRLIYQNDAGTYEIYARPRELPAFGEGGIFSVPFTVEWVADYPLWQDATENVEAIGQVIGGMHFPWICPTIFGTIINKVQINNDTTLEAPCIIEIMTSAPSVRLVNNTTGHYIEINHEIPEGYKMVVDTKEISVELVNLSTGEKIDVSHWLTTSSEFWKLVPGVNEIEIDNGVPGSSPLSYIRWHRQRLGV